MGVVLRKLAHERKVGRVCSLDRPPAGLCPDSRRCGPGVEIQSELELRLRTANQSAERSKQR